MSAFCMYCGWPVAPEGVTLTGSDAEPREGAKTHRCDDTACVCDPEIALEWDEGTDATTRGWWYSVDGGTPDLLVGSYTAADEDAARKAVERRLAKGA